MTTPAKTDVAIQQLNLSYNQVQDRLLLKVGLDNGTELLLWITHRIAKLMWHMLNGEAHLPRSQGLMTTPLPNAVVQAFKQEAEAVEILQTLDFKTAYSPREEVTTRGASLVTELKLIQSENSALLEMRCDDGLNVALNLNQASIVAICNMLQLTTKEADWPIVAPSVEASSTAIMHPVSKQVLH